MLLLRGHGQRGFDLGPSRIGQTQVTIAGAARWAIELLTNILATPDPGVGLNRDSDKGASAAAPRELGLRIVGHLGASLGAPDLRQRGLCRVYDNRCPGGPASRRRYGISNRGGAAEMRMECGLL